MAISRHKVLSEMQQQLELASSKCGNLQKQLEIVKDKVRQSSTTNLVRIELPENKENKTKTGESLETIGMNRETDYSQALSTSSSSSEEANEERDVNIIKVFYDRLGQMDYPKGQVELSDISSVDNDLDIDQLLSSVNFSARLNEGRKDKRDKKVVKKGKDKIEKTGNQKRKTSKVKTGVRNVSPYENISTKLFKQIPAKKKNVKAKPLKASDSLSATTGNLGNKPASRGPAAKAEADKMRKKKLASSGLPSAKTNSRKIFQEPIKRVMNLASQLRKTKSSTAAEKKETFADTRSLTRLHSDNIPIPPVEVIKEEKGSLEKNLVVQMTKIIEECKSPDRRLVPPKIKPGTIQRVSNRTVRNEIRVSNIDNNVKVDGGEIKYFQQDKGTSLSDLGTMANVDLKPEVETPNKNRSVTPNANAGSLKSIETAPSVKLMKRTDFKSRRSFDVKVPSTNRERRDSERKPWLIRKPPLPVKMDDVITKAGGGDELMKPKNGIIPYSGRDTKPAKNEVKKRVDLFEKVASKEKEIVDVKRALDNERPSSKFKGTSVALTRTNSSTYDDISRKGIDSLRPPSSVNTIPPPSALRGAGDYREKDPADIKTLTISQIKKMKDNLMKFNAIPFIVGQSTSKSYHIGLNIQETYSLFKQTPSMTALMVSKNAGVPDHQSVHSRGRSTRTGYTGRRSVSSGRGRESCPACEPVPERSPEQLADPWAVPQDENAIVRVCTCLPKRMISFDQVINQLYFSNMNLVKLHPGFLPKDGIIEENEAPEGKERPALLPHRPTNTLYYTKLLRSIQNLKDNIKG